MVSGRRHLRWLGCSLLLLHETCGLRQHAATERESGVIVVLPRRLHSSGLLMLLLTVARRRRGEDELMVAIAIAIAMRG